MGREGLRPFARLDAACLNGVLVRVPEPGKHPQADIKSVDRQSVRVRLPPSAPS